MQHIFRSGSDIHKVGRIVRAFQLSVCLLSTVLGSKEDSKQLEATFSSHIRDEVRDCSRWQCVTVSTLS